ncbi:hypothetical protein Fuma_00695 [Fuerstiella marisgermanici]|uniref:Uncharacterized protein n=2 Tax=Fuerstiella marisgermanici TaxID=1891926 RepID=A0A1P8WAP1_9PLAN|nr:hypothetical protein Fuma_00695 [Fuerstiella marisgermanici]
MESLTTSQTIGTSHSTLRRQPTIIPAMSETSNRQISSVALVTEQRRRVRDLAGFLKSHKVPTEYNDRTQSFVGRIATQDISQDLDIRFAEFRRNFRLKRVDLRVSEPEEGTGAIVTPWFEYRVTVTHSEEDAGEAVWRQQVTDFRDTEQLFSSAFATVFGNLFDTVEFEPPEPIDMEAFIDSIENREDDDISIEYDRTAVWCQLMTDAVPGQLYVESDRVALVTQQPQLPARLLEAFINFRACLAGIECF